MLAHMASSPPPDTAALVGNAPTDIAPTRRKRSRFSLMRLLAPLVVGLGALAIWQYFSGVVSTFILSPPAAVLHSFWLALTDGMLINAAEATLQESLLGFALGAGVAIPLGVGIARSRLIASALEPYLAMSQALPAIALAPLLVLWAGYGLLPIVLLCALIVFFPIAIATTLGLRTVPRDVLDAASVDGAAGWERLWYIELPLALPSMLAGIRAGLTYSITGAVVGEFVVSYRGLGGLIVLAQQGELNTPLVYAVMIALALLAALLYGLGRLIERVVSYLEVRS